jgi:2-methylcitrate dehydratase PrpD
MASSKGPTDRLAEFVSSCNDLDVADDLALRSGTALLDAFGLALAARGNSTFEAFVSLTKELKNPDEGCRVWGRAGRVSILDGVTANSLAVHARFQDDCDMTSWAHPGSLIVPPSVSLGELVDVDVATVIRAVLCGYATISWLGGEEVVGRSVVGRGFRASPVFGSIGAAASASVVLGLDRAQARNALAIAADNTGGVLEPVGAGADDWRVQNGTAGHRGVLAALLAQRGVVGAPRALEGPNGLLHAFAGLDEVPRVWEVDPDPRSILTVWAKPYPTLGDNVAVVSAALALREAGLDPDTIASIEVHQNAHFASYPGTSFRGPYERPSQAMASTAYAVASTLLHGRLEYQRYTTKLQDPGTTALIERLAVVPEKSYSYVDGMVVVTLKDGSTRAQAAKDLDQTLFYRDRASAQEAFAALLHETGYGEDLVTLVSTTLFNAVENPTTTPIRTVVESLGIGS